MGYTFSKQVQYYFNMFCLLENFCKANSNRYVGPESNNHIPYKQKYRGTLYLVVAQKTLLAGF